jgi:hypothetical protein
MLCAARKVPAPFSLITKFHTNNGLSIAGASHGFDREMASVRHWGNDDGDMIGGEGSCCWPLRPRLHSAPQKPCGRGHHYYERRKVASMGKLGDACRARAAECALTASPAGWRRDDALKTMYLTLAQQWLDIAEIGDLADWERELRDLATKLDCLVRPQSR